MKPAQLIQKILLAAITLMVLQPASTIFADALIDSDLFAAAVISESSYIAVGDRGRIFLSKDAGNTFHPVESHSDVSLSAVCFPDPLHGWITGQGGEILYSDTGGETWTKQPSGVKEYLLAADFYDLSHGCAVGANSTILVTSSGGKEWHQSPFNLANDIGGAYNLFAVRMIDDRRICITGDMGRFFISEDSGATWSESKSPFYDPDMMEGKIMYALNYDNGKAVAIGIDGKLACSNDAGQTWAIGDSGSREPEFFALSIVNGFGLAVGSGGHMIQTRDSGTTWKSLPVPEKIFRSWLSGVALKQGSSGSISGLVVGQYGVVGIIENETIRWR